MGRLSYNHPTATQQKTRSILTHIRQHMSTLSLHLPRYRHRQLRGIDSGHARYEPLLPTLPPHKNWSWSPLCNCTPVHTTRLKKKRQKILRNTPERRQKGLDTVLKTYFARPYRFPTFKIRIPISKMAFPGASALVVAMCWNWPERRRQLDIERTMKRKKRQNMPLNRKHQRTNKIIYK